jgi:hypothetical protein
MQDTSVSINDSFYVHVSTNNPGSSIFKFVWEISELGIKDTLQDSLFEISFKDTGNFRIVVYAINQKNLLSDPDTFKISVFAKPPITKMITSDSVFSVYDTVNFTVASFDSDGVVKAYLWSFDGQKFDTTKEAYYKKNWKSDSAGKKSLYVKCIDDDSLLSKLIAFNFEIVQGRPIVKSMHDTTIFVNDSVILHATGIDSNGTINKYLWSYDGNNFDTTIDSISKAIWAIDKPGQKTLFVKVIDDDGLVSDIDSTHINVLLGSPKVHAMDDTVIHVNDSLILHFSATDTNGTIKSYLWSFDNVNWDSTTDSYKKSYWPVSNYGKKVLYVKAIDDDGIVSSIDSSVIMVHLMAPVINTIEDTVVTINDTIILNATATDSNGTIAKFVWTTDGKSFDTTTTGSYKAFWPLSIYGQKSDFLKALETEGIIQKNDSIFREIAQVYAIDNDGISSKTAYIMLKFNLYRPTVKTMSDTTVAVNDSVMLHATGFDTNGTIKQYLWSLNKSSFDTTEGPHFKTIWSPKAFGLKKVFVKVIDDDGLVSELDSTRITVHQYAPVVFAINDFGQMKDTTISFTDSLLVPISATDTNGKIEKYYWDIGADGWNDSTLPPEAMRFIKFPSGGYVTIVVGAKDDDGIMGTDSIHVLFNRPPTSCGLKTDYNADKGGWSDFNYSTNTGSIQVSFTGEDPDLPRDNLKYDLYWGTDSNSLSKKYSGVNSAVSISGIPVQTQFFWKVIVRDLYGDSTSNGGTYASGSLPTAGIFWNLVSQNVTVPFSSGQLISYDGKLWLSTSVTDKYNGAGWDKVNSVYTSVDGISWSSISQNVVVPFSSGQLISYDGKLWLFTSVTDKYNGAGWDKVNSIYTSVDGISWSSISQNVVVPFSSGQLISYDGKLWLFTSVTDKYNGAGWDKANSIYNSIDGISWSLVSQNVVVPFSSGQLISYDGKLWLFTSVTDKYNGAGWDKVNSIYNSIDGISWSLVSQNVVVPFSSGQLISYDGKLWLFTSVTDKYNGTGWDKVNSVYTSGK